MKYLIFAFLLLAGCRPSIDVDEYKQKAKLYCENCGGLSAAFISDSGNEILCVDGHQLSQHWVYVPMAVVLGACK
jgi:hypothetical protein